jgi:hypothetical protein
MFLTVINTREICMEGPQCATGGTGSWGKLGNNFGLEGEIRFDWTKEEVGPLGPGDLESKVTEMGRSQGDQPGGEMKVEYAGRDHVAR